MLSQSDFLFLPYTIIKSPACQHGARDLGRAAPCGHSCGRSRVQRGRRRRTGPQFATPVLCRPIQNGVWRWTRWDVWCLLQSVSLRLGQPSFARGDGPEPDDVQGESLDARMGLELGPDPSLLTSHPPQSFNWGGPSIPCTSSTSGLGTAKTAPRPWRASKIRSMGNGILFT